MDNRETISRQQQMIVLAVLLAATAAIVFIPLRILAYGYLPPDDVLRHVAKAVSGKPWSENQNLTPGFSCCGMWPRPSLENPGVRFWFSVLTSLWTHTLAGTAFWKQLTA